MTTYSIVYSTRTGNTQMLAQRLKETLPEAELHYYGTPNTDALEADLIFTGFWTNQGSCDQETSDFLKTMQNKKVFLFGTAGFGGSETYFSKILSKLKENLDGSNTVVGTYMCQGKMPFAVRNRYVNMQERMPDKVKGLIENFDRALTHPDNQDLVDLVQAAMESLKDSQV